MSNKKILFPRTDVTERHVARVNALSDAALAKATGGLLTGANIQVATPYGTDWNVSIRPTRLVFGP